MTVISELAETGHQLGLMGQAAENGGLLTLINRGYAADTSKYLDALTGRLSGEVFLAVSVWREVLQTEYRLQAPLRKTGRLGLGLSDAAKRCAHYDNTVLAVENDLARSVQSCSDSVNQFRQAISSLPEDVKTAMSNMASIIDSWRLQYSLHMLTRPAKAGAQSSAQAIEPSIRYGRSEPPTASIRVAKPSTAQIVGTSTTAEAVAPQNHHLLRQSCSTPAGANTQPSAVLELHATHVNEASAPSGTGTMPGALTAPVRISVSTKRLKPAAGRSVSALLAPDPPLSRMSLDKEGAYHFSDVLNTWKPDLKNLHFTAVKSPTDYAESREDADGIGRAAAVVFACEQNRVLNDL